MSERPRILVVCIDDNADVAFMIRRRLNVEPDVHCPASYAGVAEAIEALTGGATQPPRVILLDWSMPGWSGRDAVARLVAAAPTARVVVLSGHAHEDVAGQAMDAGAWAFVSKSDDLDAIVRVVRTVGLAPS